MEKCKTCKGYSFCHEIVHPMLRKSVINECKERKYVWYEPIKDEETEDKEKQNEVKYYTSTLYRF